MEKQLWLSSSYSTSVSGYLENFRSIFIKLFLYISIPSKKGRKKKRNSSEFFFYFLLWFIFSNFFLAAVGLKKKN